MPTRMRTLGDVATPWVIFETQGRMVMEVSRELRRRHVAGHVGASPQRLVTV